MTDKFGELSGKVFRPGGLELTKWLIDTAEFTLGMKIIDIGCGTGITVEYLIDLGLIASGIDVAGERLEQGKQRASKLPLFCATAESLPFADASLDGVLAECSLSVMENVDKVLAEVSRVLVMGGRLAMSDLYTWQHSTDGIMTFAAWDSLLARHGFHLLCWKDQVKHLKNLVAAFIMQHGSADELWQCLAKRQQEHEIANPRKYISYFSLVAVKGAHRVPG